MRAPTALALSFATIGLLSAGSRTGAYWNFKEVDGTAVTVNSMQTDGQTAKADQGAAAQGPEQPRTVFHVSTAEVQVSVSVRRRGRAVEGLKREDFRLVDNGQVQGISAVTAAHAPLDLVLLLDVSGSVRQYLGEIAAISRRALKGLQPADRTAVMIFSRDSIVQQEFTSNSLEVQSAIEKASKQPPPGSGTHIYAAIAQAARYIRLQNASGIRRRAILIVTDNSGLSYNVHQERVLRELYNANATLDALVIGRHPHPPPPKAGSVINPDFAFDDVFVLAERTGGEAIPARKPTKGLEDLLNHVRERYLIVYPAPRDAAPGSFRNIKVELSPAARRRLHDTEINARDGYYVSGSERAKGAAE